MDCSKKCERNNTKKDGLKMGLSVLEDSVPLSRGRPFAIFIGSIAVPWEWRI
jgi:hypothetical protein